jgi:hypothetical protein
MVKVVTTILDVIGILLVAMGAGVAAYGAYRAGLGFAVSGTVVLLGSGLAARLDEPKRDKT